MRRSDDLMKKRKAMIAEDQDSDEWQPGSSERKKTWHVIKIESDDDQDGEAGEQSMTIQKKK